MRKLIFIGGLLFGFISMAHSQTTKKKLIKIKAEINYSASVMDDTTYTNSMYGMTEEYKGGSSTTRSGQLFLNGEWEIHEDKSTNSILIAYNYDPNDPTDHNYASGHNEIKATGGYDEKYNASFTRKINGVMDGGENRSDLTSCKKPGKVDLNIQIFQKNVNGLYSNFSINTEFAGTNTISGTMYTVNPDQRYSNKGWFPIDDGGTTEETRSVGASGSNEDGDATMSIKPTTTGYIITGQYSVTSTSGMVEKTWYTIVIGENNTKGELELSMQNEGDYKDWLPMSEKNSLYKPLVVKAKLDKTTKDIEADSMVFSLSDVTHYIGICGNEPNYELANESADLVFAPQNEQPNGIYFIDSFHVSTIGKVTEAEVKIICKDYAAYGVLKVKAVHQNIIGKSKYDLKQDLVIPRDDNSNKIADSWEEKVGMEQLNLLWDEDKYPEYQFSSGDGFTFFEEYRGFYSLEDVSADGGKLLRMDKHVRLDPNYKDVFMHDETEMFNKYYAPNNAAKTNWHLTSKHQINYNSIETDPLNRLVNILTPKSLKNNNQYALCMVFLDISDYSTAGAAIFRKGKNPEVSIKFCDFIWLHKEQLYIDTVIGRCPNQYSYDQKRQIATNQYEATVIHEIGHGLGIIHHSNGDAKYIDSNHVEIRLSKSNSMQNDDFHRALARQGVPDCAMTYTFVNNREFKGSRIFNRQITYCTKDDFYIDDYFTQKKADNCFGQIKIKCD